MRRFWFCAVVMLPCLFFSCARSANKGAIDTSANEVQTAPSVAPAATPSTIKPLAIVQAGEFPLWFQFTDDGPVLLESIEDACFSAALIPWPLAPHVRFMLANNENLMMAVNRGGFLCFAPWAGHVEGQGAASTGLYYISGGEFWRQYTVGAFFLYDAQPAALLYRDDRFLDIDSPLPAPRLWTFDLYANKPRGLTLPALDLFAPEDGWDIDVLRCGGDGSWYFRAVKKMTSQPEIRMLRSGDLVEAGKPVSLSAFQNAALPEPLSAAPEPLRKMLTAAFAENGCGIATVISPEFQINRSFAANREKAAISGFFSGGVFLATQPQGAAVYIEASSGRQTSGVSAVRQFSLPPLPAGFVYTGIGMVAGTIIASWEEQDEYSTGAAGFMVIQYGL